VLRKRRLQGSPRDEGTAKQMIVEVEELRDEIERLREENERKDQEILQERANKNASYTQELENILMDSPKPDPLQEL
jgi:dsDNA-specific endonuclease/ATPase MutS2